jgi:hypothetical protein
MERSSKSPVSFVAHVGRLPRKGMPVVVEANEKQRAALARDHDLAKVERYRAELTVEPWKRNGVRVSGSVVADIVQECVVTLDPIATRIHETFESIFLPEDSRLGREGFHVGGEIVLEPDGPDSPETFGGDTLDVGALAEEHFGLAIDPYPRKASAALPPEISPADGEPEEGPLQQKLRLLRHKL